MAKKSIDIAPAQNHEVALTQIKKVLGQQCACCILITCTSPSGDGKMDVEMSFDGEETLAAFLIENASQVFDARLEKKNSIKNLS